MQARFLQQHRRGPRKRAIAGFSLLEILVVLIIIGILFSIAAAGWVTLMNRQRVNTVREQAAQIIRQAQADAQRTKLARVVVFDYTTQIPRAAVQTRPLDPTTGRTAGFLDAGQVDAIENWQTLGNGDVGAGFLVFEVFPTTATNQGQIIFDGDGTVADASADAATAERIFTVNFRANGTSAETNRCVVVKTLLGATRSTEGSDCPAS